LLKLQNIIAEVFFNHDIRLSDKIGGVMIVGSSHIDDFVGAAF
jgi:hypothetical protein